MEGVSGPWGAREFFVARARSGWMCVGAQHERMVGRSVKLRWLPYGITCTPLPLLRIAPFPG